MHSWDEILFTSPHFASTILFLVVRLSTIASLHHAFNANQGAAVPRRQRNVLAGLFRSRRDCPMAWSFYVMSLRANITIVTYLANNVLGGLCIAGLGGASVPGSYVAVPTKE
ncbi:hypothetical protein V8B97DRAFT_1920038 [Scleroderma yunnanense]